FLFCLLKRIQRRWWYRVWLFPHILQVNLMGNTIKVKCRIAHIAIHDFRDLPGNAVDGLIGQVLSAGATTTGQDDDELTANLVVFLSGLLAAGVEPGEQLLEGLRSQIPLFLAGG